MVLVMRIVCNKAWGMRVIDAAGALHSSTILGLRGLRSAAFSVHH
jgi:hypothetical protein